MVGIDQHEYDGANNYEGGGSQKYVLVFCAVFNIGF